jgi:hypothetical protein
MGADNKQNTFLLFHYDKLDEMWHDDGPVFTTIEKAEDEIKALMEIMPGCFKREEFAIVPNDGIAQKKYRAA